MSDEKKREAEAAAVKWVIENEVQCPNVECDRTPLGAFDTFRPNLVACRYGHKYDALTLKNLIEGE